MSGNTGVMKLNATLVLSAIIQLGLADRVSPCAAIRRVIGPRSRAIRRIAVLAAISGSAVEASAPASVPVLPMAPTARSRASAGALTRSIASSLRFLK